MGTATAAPARPMRADAKRNYDRIVDVAGTAFAKSGVFASLDDIACKAGVGPGTLYRHFPTRDSLIVVTLSDSLNRLAELGDRLTAAADPRAALDEWMLTLAEHLRTYDNLPESIADAYRCETSPLRNSCSPLIETTAVLVARAKSAGAVREDVDPQDLFALVGSVAWACERRRATSAELQRMLALATGGIR